MSTSNMQVKNLLTQKISEISKTDPDPETRIIRRIEIGKAIHQGDVYLHRVPANHPKGEILGTKQVAVGSSVGARHVVQGIVSVYEGKKLPKGVTEPDFVNQGDLLGPVIVAKEAFTLTHPEHAHHQLPAGCYQTTYQADFSMKSRVLD